MFSLDDHNTRKVFFTAVLLERRVDKANHGEIKIHAVVARNQEEAFGIIALSYNELDSTIVLKAWEITADYTPQILQNLINDNNKNLVEELVVPGGKS